MCLKYIPLCSDFCFVPNPFHALSSARSLCLGSQILLFAAGWFPLCFAHHKFFCSARWPFVVEFANVSNWKQTQPCFTRLILLQGTVVQPTERTKILPAWKRGGRWAQIGTKRDLCVGQQRWKTRTWLNTGNLNLRRLTHLDPFSTWKQTCYASSWNTSLSSLFSSCSGPAITEVLPLWFPAELINSI